MFWTPSVRAIAAAAAAGACRFQHRVLSVVASTTQWTPATGYANGYLYRRRIVIPATSGSVPELWFSEVNASFKTVANGGRINSAAGWDIRVETGGDNPTGTGGVKRAHFIDTYNGADGTLKLWARITNATTVFLYYGKAGLLEGEENQAATTSGYVAWWNPRTGVDYTGQGRTLTPNATIAAATLYGDAGDFDGAKAAKSTSFAWLDGLAAITIDTVTDADSAMVGSNSGWFAQGPLGSGASGGVYGLGLRYRPNPPSGTGTNFIFGVVRTSLGTCTITSAASAHSTDPQHVALRWGASPTPAISMLIDGAVSTPVASAVFGGTTLMGTAAVGSNPPVLAIGGSSLDTADGGWDGRCYMVRIRASAVSTAQLAAEALNLRDPQNFYGMGGEDAFGDTNQAPVAVPTPPYFTVVHNTATLLPVIADDFDPEALALTIKSGSITTPTKAIAPTISSNKLLYTPNAGAVGEDSFFYEVQDPAPGSKTSRGKVKVWIESPASPPPPPPPGGASSYDIDLSKSPWKDMDNQDVSGDFSDVLTAAQNGPTGRFYTWKGASAADKDKTYNADFTWASTKGGTAAKPKIIRTDGNPGVYKVRNAQVVLAGPWCGLMGIQFSGRRGSSLVSLNAQGVRLDRCRMTAWGHNNPTVLTSSGARATSTWSAHALAVSATAHDAKIIRCEVDTPLAWTAAEVQVGIGISKLQNPQGRGLLKMGIRVPGNRLSESPKRVIIAYTYFHDFIGKPEPGNYDSGQTDFAEVGFSHDDWASTDSVDSIMDTCLFDTTDGEAGLVDFKSPAWLIRRVTVKGCPGGNLSLRGNGGGHTVESCYIAGDCLGLNVMGPNNVIKGVVMGWGTAADGPRLRLLSGHTAAQRAPGGSPGPGSTRIAAINTRIYGGSSQIWLGYNNGTATAQDPVTGAKIWGHVKPSQDVSKGYKTKSSYTWSNQVNTNGYWENSSEWNDPATVNSPVAFVNGTQLLASAVGINS